MIAGIPPEITLASFSLLSLFAGYIWNGQAKRISKIERVQTARPCTMIHLRIEKIATDIDWIKKEIDKQNR